MIAMLADNGRPSPVQIAPVSSQACGGKSNTSTASSHAGFTVISHRSRRLSTCRASVTSPPLTSTLWSRNASSPIAIASLKAIRSVNARSPSCSLGASTKCAVNGSAVRPGALSSTRTVTVGIGRSYVTPVDVWLSVAVSPAADAGAYTVTVWRRNQFSLVNRSVAGVAVTPVVFELTVNVGRLAVPT